MTHLNYKWIPIYQAHGGYWLHDGNPKRPHALLTSGLHSGGFCNSQVIIEKDSLLVSAATDLIFMFARQNNNQATLFDGIVGPQTGATKLATFLADARRKHYKTDCFHASPAKHEQESVKSMIFSDVEMALVRGKTVLLCEDVITTGGSVVRAAEAVLRAGGTALPFVCTMVNRSGLTEVDGRTIVQLIEQPMPTWQPGECPHCKLGSEAIRPKKPEINWAALNAVYA